MAIVCIIDDDAMIRKSLTSLLKSAGHTAAPFASGEDFLASPQPVCAACILLDLELKGVNGLEVQRQLIERGVDAPVVFISSHGDDESVGRALEQGARAFLHKPFSSDEILELIERFSAGRAPWRESKRDAEDTDHASAAWLPVGASSRDDTGVAMRRLDKARSPVRGKRARMCSVSFLMRAG